jgi:hypothetical protein
MFKASHCFRIQLIAPISAPSSTCCAKWAASSLRRRRMACIFLVIIFIESCTASAAAIREPLCLQLFRMLVCLHCQIWRRLCQYDTCLPLRLQQLLQPGLQLRVFQPLRHPGDGRGVVQCVRVTPLSYDVRLPSFAHLTAFSDRLKSTLACA